MVGMVQRVVSKKKREVRGIGLRSKVPQLVSPSPAPSPSPSPSLSLSLSPSPYPSPSPSPYPSPSPSLPTYFFPKL